MCPNIIGDAASEMCALHVSVLPMGASVMRFPGVVRLSMELWSRLNGLGPPGSVIMSFWPMARHAKPA
jgi:hypothetical protein